MIEIRSLELPLSAGGESGDAEMRRAAAKRLGVDVERIASLRLLKRSVDARRKANVHFVVTLGVTLRPASGTTPGTTPEASDAAVDAAVDGGAVDRDEAEVVRRVADDDVFVATETPSPAIARRRVRRHRNAFPRHRKTRNRT